MKTCKELHPQSKINLGFTCCADMFREFKEKFSDTDDLLTIVDSANQGVMFPFGETYDLYGIKRNTQFEGYGRATECDEQPWKAFILNKFSGDKDEISRDFKTFREALIWLAFKLWRLKQLEEKK